MQYKLRQTAVLRKSADELVVVEIEGRSESVKLAEPLYDVREVVSRIGYPASESSLQPFSHAKHEHLLPPHKIPDLTGSLS